MFLRTRLLNCGIPVIFDVQDPTDSRWYPSVKKLWETWEEGGRISALLKFSIHRTTWSQDKAFVAFVVETSNVRFCQPIDVVRAVDIVRASKPKKPRVYSYIDKLWKIDEQDILDVLSTLLFSPEAGTTSMASRLTASPAAAVTMPAGDFHLGVPLNGGSGVGGVAVNPPVSVNKNPLSDTTDLDALIRLEIQARPAGAGGVGVNPVLGLLYEREPAHIPYRFGCDYG